MFKFLSALLGAFALFLVSTTSTSAAFTIGPTPNSVDESNGNGRVTVNLSVSGQAGSSYYLRAAFSHPTTPTSYFGYTLNNSGNWYNGVPSPIDYTQFYRVTLDSNGSWTGIVDFKPDPASSNYKGTGDYIFKVGRYTQAGSGPTWSDNTVTITITKQQTFQLAMGWSLVGLTVEKEAILSAEVFLQELNASFVPSTLATPPGRQIPTGNKVLSITRFDPSRGRYFTHTLGSTENNFPIVLGEGYFVRSIWPGTATIVGLAPTLSSITIARGLSMISFPRTLTGITNAEQLLQAFQNQGIDVRLVVRWFAGRWLPHDLGSSANNFSISPGEGYFIRNFGQAGTFNLP